MNTYSKTAIRTFAACLTGLTCNKVKIKLQGSLAYTDGQTLVLPAQGVWKEYDFSALCGLACHEVSHIWFESSAFLQDLLSKFASHQQARVQMCFNAVIDVADETRFIRAMPGAEALLESLHTLAFRSALKAGSMSHQPPIKADSPWQLLAAAIWLVRSENGSEIRNALRRWPNKVAGLNEACRILSNARDRAKQNSFTAQRNRQEWDRIRKLVVRLVSLIERLFPEETALQQPSDALADWFKMTVEATSTRSAYAEMQGVRATRNQWDRVLRADADSVDDYFEDGGEPDDLIELSHSDYLAMDFDESAYLEALAVYRRLARLMVKGPTVSFEEGCASGIRLSRPDRVYLDGRCFRRRTIEEGVQAAVAMLFDHSDSMRGFLPVFLPAGLALARALESTPDIDFAAWRFGTDIEQIERTDDLKDAYLMGGTRTDMALAEAFRWLSRRDAAVKAVILFTDGGPDDQGATMHQARELRRLGARLLVGSIGYCLDRCAMTIPGAIIFDLNPADAASSLQVALKRARE